MSRKRKQTPRVVFVQDVPAAFLRDWLMALVLRNRAIHEEVATRYSPEAAGQVAPHLRRMSHEDALFDLGKKHGGTSNWVWNRVESHQHVEVMFGRVVLTQNMVHEETSLPRYAQYRDSLARDPQMAFDFVNGLEKAANDDAEDEKVYAQLLHGPPMWRARVAGLANAMPAFARVVFPINGSDQFEDYIPLNSVLTGLIYRKQVEEHISDDLQLELKPKPEANKDDD